MMEERQVKENENKSKAQRASRIMASRKQKKKQSVDSPARELRPGAERK